MVHPEDCAHCRGDDHLSLRSGNLIFKSGDLGAMVERPEIPCCLQEGYSISSGFGASKPIGETV
jgi:hypothetical protein